jgi:hypothetical protein
MMIEGVVTAAVWAVSNVVYFDLKRKGVRGFRRFLAFWMGTPWTWVSFFVVKEGSQPTFEPPPDDEALLFQEVRRDRMLRERSERPPSFDGSAREAVTPEV